MIKTESGGEGFNRNTQNEMERKWHPPNSTEGLEYENALIIVSESDYNMGRIWYVHTSYLLFKKKKPSSLPRSPDRKKPSATNALMVSVGELRYLLIKVGPLKHTIPVSPSFFSSSVSESMICSGSYLRCSRNVSVFDVENRNGWMKRYIGQEWTDMRVYILKEKERIKIKLIDVCINVRIYMCVYVCVCMYTCESVYKWVWKKREKNEKWALHEKSETNKKKKKVEDEENRANRWKTNKTSTKQDI